MEKRAKGSAAALANRCEVVFDDELRVAMTLLDGARLAMTLKREGWTIDEERLRKEWV